MTDVLVTPAADPVTTAVVPQNMLQQTASAWTSRKFFITLFVQAVGAVGFMRGRMDGGTYVALSSLVLSIYGASSVADKKLNPGQ
jgi:hypothetical protein